MSTHSFGRWRSLTGGESLLTKMHRQGHSLRTMQQITRHADIGNLAKYLDIGQDEADEALFGVWG